MWGLVRTGWPDFNSVLVSPGLSAGNYGGEKVIKQRWAAQRGGRAHAQQGGEFCHRRDQSSVKQSTDLGPWFSGKRLGHWFRAPQLSRISRDTILYTEKGNTARRQHQCKCACTQTQSHSLPLSFPRSHTKPTNSWEEGYSHRHITIATAYLTFEPKWRHFGLKPAYLFFQ